MSEKTEDNVLIVKYGEIAVRGNNRKFFYRKASSHNQKKSGRYRRFLCR